MPAFTANRNYPYSVPGDPADVPAAIQALAEAVDTDLTSISSYAAGRPMFRLRGTQNRTVPPGSFNVPFVWDTVDFDNGALDLSTVGSSLIKIKSDAKYDGRWLVIANAVCPPTVGATGLLTYGLRIQTEITADRTEVRLHNFPTATETSGRLITGSAFIDFNFTLNLSVQGLLERSANNNPYTYREQTLTVMQCAAYF